MTETIIEYEALLKLNDWDLKRLSVTHLGDYSKLVKAGKIQVNKIKWHKTVNLGDGFYSLVTSHRRKRPIFL